MPFNHSLDGRITVYCLNVMILSVQCVRIISDLAYQRFQFITFTHILFQDMLDLMDPSRNMSKYRNLLNSAFVQPPMVSSLFTPLYDKILSFCMRKPTIWVSDQV